MVPQKFQEVLSTRYEATKARFPGEGRRKWRLRILYESWPILKQNEPSVLNAQVSVDAQADPDRFDSLLEDEELGLLIRTDFTNDAAWDAFCQKVNDAQKDFLSELRPSAPSSAQEDVEMKDDSQGDEEDSDSDSESSTMPNFIKIYDPPPNEREIFTNITNLGALRLFNDVDIRESPNRPAGTKPVSPSNPLIDQNGWQEIYTGKNLWIYDTRSNIDECVRVVGQTSDFYGTATGDSWRARCTHVCELQFNMSYQGLKIDFNGVDRWDHAERSRNLADAFIL